MEENHTEVPEGWKEIALGEVLGYEQPYKYAVDSTDYNDKSGVPVLTAGKSFILGYTDETENVYTGYPVVIFDDFTTDSKFVDFPFKVKSSAMKFLKSKSEEELDLKFVFGNIQTLKIRETGGDHKRRWISEFSKLKICLPPITEQRQIATILSKVDEAISQTERLIAKYTRIKTGLMQDLLARGIDEHGHIRSEETHAFKDSPLGRIPEEWEVIPLGKLSEISSGLTLGKEYPKSGTREMPYLRVANVQDGYLDLSEIKYVRVPVAQIDKLKLEIGDVLMNEGGDYDKLGRGAVWGGEIVDCLHQNHVFKVRLDKTEMLPEYLSVYSASNYGKSFFIVSSKQSTNLASINKTQLSEFPILRPKLKEQIKIISMMTEYSTLLQSFDNSLFKLQSLKTGLMQDLLSGKVRVNHLVEETTELCN